MPEFELVAPFQPTGDQPQAIDKLADGLARRLRHLTLLGVTGSGKTRPSRGFDPLRPELRSAGWAPAYGRSWSKSVKRPMSPISAMRVAAIDGPTPGIVWSRRGSSPSRGTPTPPAGSPG